MSDPFASARLAGYTPEGLAATEKLLAKVPRWQPGDSGTPVSPQVSPETPPLTRERDSGDSGDTPIRRTRWTAAELLAEQFPEPRWSVPGIIPEG